LIGEIRDMELEFKLVYVMKTFNLFIEWMEWELRRKEGNEYTNTPTNKLPEPW
jgi:hypothetical protein